MTTKKTLLKIANLFEKQINIDNIILNQVKKRKSIIYGARSIQKQNPMLSRDTKDYDIFDIQPKIAANLLQKKLDKNIGFDYYYSKPAEHKGTYKVKNKGLDLKKNTKDDESIADFTKIEKNTTYKIINGIKYRILQTELQKKIKVINDPKFKFRHEKDKDDINRIKTYLKIKQIVNN